MRKTAKLGILVTLLLVSGLPAFCDSERSDTASQHNSGETSALQHNNAGVQLGMKGSWEEAIAEHELAVKADPGNKDFRTNLSAACLRYGNKLFKKHDYKKAAEQFRRAVEVDSKNIPAKEGLEKCEQELKHAS